MYVTDSISGLVLLVSMDPVILLRALEVMVVSLFAMDTSTTPPDPLCIVTDRNLDNCERRHEVHSCWIHSCHSKMQKSNHKVCENDNVLNVHY